MPEDENPYLDTDAIAAAGQKLGEDLTYTSGNLAKSFILSIASGHQPKEIFGLNPAQMEAMYGRAYGHFNAGQYDQAKHFFRVLSTIDSLDPRYSFGLAACYHMQKKYGVALATYSIVAVQDPENPMPVFHAADCEMQLGNQAGAYENLKTTIARCGDRKEFAQVKEKAKLLMEGIRQARLKKKAEKKEEKKIL